MRLIISWQFLVASLSLYCVGFEVTRQTYAAEKNGIVLVTPNIDDDDGDGRPDGDDRHVNGPDDYLDLTRFEIPFTVDAKGVSFTGTGRSHYQLVEIERHSNGSVLLVEARQTRTSASAATLTARSRDLEKSFSINTSPLLLTSSLDRPREVFVVAVPKSRPFVKAMESILQGIPDGPLLNVLSVEDGDDSDVWIQDATEIGRFNGSTMSVALHGLRGKHYRGPPSCNAGPLDEHFARSFLEPDQALLKVGESLANRRWIDWFGNLEVSPPCSVEGRIFPRGRILTGRQGKLTMHDAVMDFLEAQESQWPPVVLDTGFLVIGHVDEIINFVPSHDGFKALLASPAKGRELLETLVAGGDGDAVILKGKESESTATKLLNNEQLMAANERAQVSMANNRALLKQELGLTERDIIDVPLLFKRDGRSLWPNMLNGLVVEDHLICPMPFGPIIDGEDAIESAFRRALADTPVTVHFVDVYDAYSRMAGECHCGTNAIRDLADQ